MKQNIKQFFIYVALGLYSCAVQAFEYGDITYEVDAYNKAVITGFKNERASYVIDSVIHKNEKIPVVAIGKNAFKGSSILAMITLPKTLERIEESAFNNTGLAFIVIPDAVTFIGDNAFSLCSNLRNIKITSSSSLTTIGRSAFSYCESLDSIFIPKSVTSIGKNTFSNCKKLSSMKVEAGNTVYDSRNDCNAIIQTQGNLLAFGCKETNIPNNIVTIGENAFYGSRFGESGNVVLPDALITIEGSAFYNCALKIVKLPNTVQSIGDNAFSLCSDLESISLSPSLLSIGRSAFSYTKLKGIIIPKSVLTIGKNAFSNCEDLSSILVEEGNVFYSSPDNCNAVLQGDKLIVGCSGTTIPQSATSIGEGAFYGSGLLGDIVIPSSVKTIEEQGFYNCGKLTSITINEGLTTIGRYAFSLCSNLKKIQLPSSLKSIDRYVFHYCDNVKEISSLITKPFTIDNSVFDGLYETAKLCVPTGTKSSYQQTSGWNFSTIEEFDPSGISSTAIALQRIYSDNGIIYIESAADGSCNIYSMSGQLFRRLELKKGTNTVTGLAKGIYIVNGQKTMVK